MRSLVIVESPAKCKKIESYLGSDEYACVASYGHFRELASLNDIDAAFEITFTEQADKAKHIKTMRTAIRRTIKGGGRVILATDDDREGEAIAWHICDAFGLDVKTTPRIVFREITRDAIRNAVAHPGIVDMQVVDAQHARQIIDMAIGYKISPLLWTAITRKSKMGLSAGRCQTPALRIVRENNRLVNEHPGTLSYTTVGYFTSHNIPFELNTCHTTDVDVSAFLEESVNFEHTLSCADPVLVTKTPPKPLITSTMQQHASSVLGYSPKESMAICQRLYERGLITYMRTDSHALSADFVSAARTFIEREYGVGYAKSIEEPDCGIGGKGDKGDKGEKGGAPQEAHEAIRPTDVEVATLPGEETCTKERRMYVFIRGHTLKCCMAAARMNKVVATVTAPEGARYRYSALQVAFAGFMAVDRVNDDPYFSFLGACVPCMSVSYNTVTSKCTLKHTKSRVNEARLVQLLEERGIGRPSTFSSLVDKIQSRGYVKKKNVDGRKMDVVNFSLTDDTVEERRETAVFGSEKNRLVVQPVGELVLDFLGENFDAILNYDYTRTMEGMLDGIAEGTDSKARVCGQYYTDIAVHLATYLEGAHDKVSHRFDAHNEYIIGAHGPVIKCTHGEVVTWKKVKQGITLAQIRESGATLVEVVDDASPDRVLGTFKETQVVLKVGRYGPYVVYGDKNISLGRLVVDKAKDKITIADVIDLLEVKDVVGEGGGSDGGGGTGEVVVSGNPAILRVISASVSVRKGRFGNYIYYQTPKMTRPKFVKLGAMADEFMTCHKHKILDLVSMAK
jgi:DNA topoisomerase-1